MDSLKDLAEATVGAYQVAALGLIVLLVLLVLYLWWSRPSQGFMPGATLRYQKLDGLGFEGMAGGDAPGQAVKEGSPAWNVLHSKDFGCDKRAEPNDDAWSWMYNQRNASEGATGGRRPRTDDDLSKIAAGQ
jgi:hypothetical protein